MQVIAIIGASGFIGKRLVMELVRTGEYDIRVLSRNRQRDLTEKRFASAVDIIEGDLSNTDALKKLLKPGCTVINLAYLWDVGEAENLAVIDSLVEACRDVAVERLIHCSTAAVVGRVRENRITEETMCNPVSQYGVTKLKIEQEVVRAVAHNYFDAVIVRPTAVFGSEGEQLKKLAQDLKMGTQWLNYVKSCLFGARRMNLVHIDNVVAAMVFLIRYPNPLGGEVFIVSDDDDPDNNFAYVERFMLRVLGADDYCLPRLSFPLWMLTVLLAIRGRNNINPSCVFDSGKIRRLGYKPLISIEAGLNEYAIHHHLPSSMQG